VYLCRALVRLCFCAQVSLRARSAAEKHCANGALLALRRRPATSRVLAPSSGLFTPFYDTEGECSPKTVAHWRRVFRMSASCNNAQSQSAHSQLGVSQLASRLPIELAKQPHVEPDGEDCLDLLHDHSSGKHYQTLAWKFPPSLMIIIILIQEMVTTCLMCSMCKHMQHKSQLDSTTTTVLSMQPRGKQQPVVVVVVVVVVPMH